MYLHKTVLSVEHTLIKILSRAKELILLGNDIFTTTALKTFLSKDYTIKDFMENESLIDIFSKLDDYDIYCCIKEWSQHRDFILSDLSRRIVERDPLKIITRNKQFTDKEIEILRHQSIKEFNINVKEANYLVFTNKVSNNTYHYSKTHINILMKDGSVKDITEASDQFNIEALSKTVNKYFLCYPTISTTKRIY